MTPTEAQIETAADALIDHIVPFPLDGADTIEMSGMYSYDELKAIAETALAAVLTDIDEKIEAYVDAVEIEAEKEGRDNPTLRTIKLIRAQGMREALAIIRGETP